jgi:hypothetical protein
MDPGSINFTLLQANPTFNLILLTVDLLQLPLLLLIAVSHLHTEQTLTHLLHHPTLSTARIIPTDLPRTILHTSQPHLSHNPLPFPQP